MNDDAHNLKSPRRLCLLGHCLVLLTSSILLFSSAFAVVNPRSTPILRGTHPFNQMKLSPKGRFLAFTEEESLGLHVIDLQTHNIYQVSKEKVGQSFFWSPDGYRVFYRELVRSPLKPSRSDLEDDKKDLLWETPIRSIVKAFDCSATRRVEVDMIPRSTGLLTFDPRDLRFLLMSESGIHTKKIHFPGQRLAQWQIASRHEQGKWLATQKGILWVTQGGLTMKKLDDDGSPLSSFDISPDGQWIAWSTEKSKIYVSHEGRKSTFLGHGMDPKWHPTRHLIVFAGARMVGDKPVNYDLKIADVRGQSKFLTATQFSSERWPQWEKGGHSILYTVDRTTDLYLLEFRP